MAASPAAMEASSARPSRASRQWCARLTRSAAACAAAVMRRECLAPGAVQASPLGGQACVVDGLLEQGVPEAVGIVIVEGARGHEQAGLDEGAQVAVPGRCPHPSRTVDEHVVLDLATAHGGHADDVAGRGRAASSTRARRTSRRVVGRAAVGHRSGRPASSSMKKGLPSERRWISAISAPGRSSPRMLRTRDAVSAVRRGARGRCARRGHRATTSASQGRSGCLRVMSSLRKVAITRHRRALRRAQEVRGRRQRPRVGPVEVLELHQQRRRVRRGGRSRSRSASWSRVRAQSSCAGAGSSGPGPARAGPGRPAPRPASAATVAAPSWATSERRISVYGAKGSPASPMRDAAARQHPHALLRRPARAIGGEQAGLADPGLAADDRVTRLALPCAPRERPRAARPASLPADQHRAASSCEPWPRSYGRLLPGSPGARQVSRTAWARRPSSVRRPRPMRPALPRQRRPEAIADGPSSGPGGPAGRGRPRPAGPAGGTAARWVIWYSFIVRSFDRRRGRRVQAARWP